MMSHSAQTMKRRKPFGNVTSSPSRRHAPVTPSRHRGCLEFPIGGVFGPAGSLPVLVAAMRRWLARFRAPRRRDVPGARAIMPTMPILISQGFFFGGGGDVNAILL